jgi:NAD+ synthase
MEPSNLQSIHSQIIKGIQKYFKKAGYTRAVIGVSGGVDSSLTLKLAVDALEAENVAAISMPELGVSSQENIDHAKGLCHALGVKFFYQPLNQFLIDFPHLPWDPNKLATQNTKARLRAVLLYNYANTADALVLGTSNKSEILLGYGTKYGDLAADLEVIADLYKDEVFALADFIGLPPEIITKPPTAELYPGQTDEGELGAGYGQIDPILKRIKLGADGLIERGMNPRLVHSVIGRVAKNRHKAEMPPVIRVKKE